MTANELEVLLTAAMLLALPVIAMCYWRDNRAISWGALGLCLLIPEAASERPNGALLHSIMAITAVIVVLQLWIDALKQRQHARDAEAAQPATLESQPEAATDARAARDETLAPAAAPWTGGYHGAPQPAGVGLHFLRRRHDTAHGKHEGQRP